MPKSTIITNKTGIKLDFTNLYGNDKIEPSELENLKPKIAWAVQAIEKMRLTGEISGHLSKTGKPEPVLFGQLPYVKEGNLNSPSSLAKIKNWAEKIKKQVDIVVSFGIGGSYLGSKVLFDVGCGTFWNQADAKARDNWPQLYFSGNNVDAQSSHELLQHLLNQTYCLGKEKCKIVLVIISKSGSTLEPMSCFMYFYQELNKYSQIELEIVAITDPQEGSEETLLHRLALDNNWDIFSVPDGVGGRFSVFSEVGLVLAAVTGLDIEKFLQGARDMDEACQNSEPFENMALLNAVLKYLAAEQHGRDIEIFMPYADKLKSLAEWYVQLLAESLGKEKNKAGETIYYGRTPVVAVGTTDMHAQTQQHQEGKLNKVVQFVQIEKWLQDPKIINPFQAAKELNDLAGFTFGQAMNAALAANASALINNNRFNATYIMPELNLYYLGALMYMLALSVAYEGELAQVDAFDQPGVEAYKKILKKSLAEIKV